MSSSVRQGCFDRVLIDLNTQCDFLLPRGAVPVANREQMLPNVRRLMSWARNTRLPVISTIDSHRAGERSNGFPPYCIDRTPGQKKLPFTLLPRRIILHGDNTLDLPIEAFRRYRQLIFTKRSGDFLSNPKADRLVSQLRVHHLIVFGVITECCVKAAVLSLIARLRRVVVVKDACGFWSPPDAELAMRQMEAKGAVMVTTEELISGAADERIQASRALEIEKTIDDNAAENGRPVTASTRFGVEVVADDRSGHNGNGRHGPLNGSPQQADGNGACAGRLVRRKNPAEDAPVRRAARRPAAASKRRSPRR